MCRPTAMPSSRPRIPPLQTFACLGLTHDYTVFPYWDDQRTDANSGCSAFPGGTCGIFTSVTGSAPNRIFNIEWRTVYFADANSTANYELRLYEGQTHFDVSAAMSHRLTVQPQLACRRTILTSISTSATAQVVPRRADKATSCKPAERRRQHRLLVQVLRQRLQLQ